jgi:hypothetical protein
LVIVTDILRKGKKDNDMPELRNEEFSYAVVLIAIRCITPHGGSTDIISKHNLTKLSL